MVIASQDWGLRSPWLARSKEFHSNFVRIVWIYTVFCVLEIEKFKLHKIARGSADFDRQIDWDRRPCANWPCIYHRSAERIKGRVQFARIVCILWKWTKRHMGCIICMSVWPDGTDAQSSWPSSMRASILAWFLYAREWWFQDWWKTGGYHKTSSCIRTFPGILPASLEAMATCSWQTVYWHSASKNERLYPRWHVWFMPILLY
jgi:hypothetical protein